MVAPKKTSAGLIVGGFISALQGATVSLSAANVSVSAASDPSRRLYLRVNASADVAFSGPLIVGVDALPREGIFDLGPSVQSFRGSGTALTAFLAKAKITPSVPGLASLSLTLLEEVPLSPSNPSTKSTTAIISADGAAQGLSLIHI